MNATRFFMAAVVLASVIGANQANAQCSSNAGSCNTTNTASVTMNALVKLDMGSTTTSLTSPTVAQVEIGAVIADRPDLHYQGEPQLDAQHQDHQRFIVDLCRLTRRHEAHQRPELVERGRGILRRNRIERRTLPDGSERDERPRCTGFLQDRLGRRFHAAQQRSRYVQLANRFHALGALVEAIQSNASLEV